MTTQYIYDLVDTWNNGATTFTSIKMDVTDSASNAASLLMDLQVSTASKFSVSKTGSATFALSAAFPGGTTSTLPIQISSSQYGFYRGSAGGGAAVITTCAGVDIFAVGQNNGVGVINTGPYAWATTIASTPDLFLTRRAAANLRFGSADAAAPVAQTLSVQSVVAGTTNTAGTNLTITGSQGTGTGAGGSIIFQVAAAGSSGSAQNALATALTIDSTRLATFALAAAFPGGSTSALPIQLSAANYGLYRGSAGGGGAVITTCAGTDIFAVGQNNGVGVVNIGPYTWASTIASTQDLFLYRDDANKLALRNGTTAQEMRVYETTTGTIYKAILGNRQLIKIAGAAFDNGAGASAGTLTNAPAVGNPTKWIPIDDNGTTRHIPAW